MASLDEIRHSLAHLLAAAVLKKYPKTKLGRKVKDGKIKDINEILDKKEKILEPEIVDSLLNLKTDFNVPLFFLFA